jgi:cell division protein FtsB
MAVTEDDVRKLAVQIQRLKIEVANAEAQAKLNREYDELAQQRNHLEAKLEQLSK